MAHLEELLREFPVGISWPVQWGEMDAYQHVNNSVYLRYFESARIAYLAKLSTLGQVFAEGFGPIIAELTCRYLIPLTFPDTIRVGARVVSYYEFGFIQEYAVVSEKMQAVAATGLARVVVYDFKSQRKAPLDAQLLAKLEKIEGHPIVRTERKASASGEA